MPRLSGYFIRASLLYLALGTTYGALLLWNKALPFSGLIWLLRPNHVDIMFTGWMTQFVLGVAFWILPRRGSAKPRGNQTWSVAAFALINISLIAQIMLVYVNHLELYIYTRPIQVVGIALFLIGNWWRIYALKFPEYGKSK